MQQDIMMTLDSPGFERLQTLFRALRKPYGVIEIVHFNRLYSRLYGQLSAAEKRCTEAWVDQIVANLEKPELASRLYGVV
jgi:hypothetical protein